MVTVYAQSMDDPHPFDSYFEYTAAMFPSFGFELVDNIVCTNANDPESAEHDAELQDPRLRSGQGARAVSASPDSVSGVHADRLEKNTHPSPVVLGTV